MDGLLFLQDKEEESFGGDIYNQMICLDYIGLIEAEFHDEYVIFKGYTEQGSYIAKTLTRKEVSF
ncbi:hypothetical protein HB852_02660 [Listeria grandensis]|uniref:Uncharacterized protein n=3 Tax=Listeria grandensis TaxID=1494963 RepID=W7BVQ1_9LIST|nr:hypothetical protein [Listeria grandensis]EUJ24403.1 hypothetical protein PGRAN_00745 [Listeria grandensis FSL F6-0971]MBC1473524.1 hypothetical protein [Listeria grandensis]MBC1935550.1 hypothetical protein [Listeria grandensis]MBC6315031.1 hypothetical protein [Listeria grandensis]